MYLGFDLGTTNVKAVVVDSHGRIVDTGAAPVDRFATPDGGVEQDIEQIWAATCNAIRKATANLDASQIQAVGVSSQGGAMQLLDDSGQPIDRVISWLDGRGQPFDAQLTSELGQAFLCDHIGHGASAMTLGQILRLQRQLPETWRKVRSIGFVGDIIVRRLCGRRAHDPTSLAIAMLYNPWRQQADADMLTRLGIDEAQLPDLLPATSPAGTIHSAASQMTGLPAGIPVSPAIHDQYAVSLGACSVHAGDVTFGAGTAWVLLANDRQLKPPVTPDAFACSHPVPGLFGQMLSVRNGGSAIDWVLKLLGQNSVSPGTVDQMVEQTPAGSDGLRFWPLLTPIAAIDATMASGGSITGVTLSHEPRHFLRAVIEGLACELMRHLSLLTVAGVPVERLMMCGSAASSRTTPQIVADVTGRPVTCVHAFDVSALGAAAVARAMAHHDIEFSQLAAVPAADCDTLFPGEHSDLYRRLFEDYLRPFTRE